MDVVVEYLCDAHIYRLQGHSLEGDVERPAFGDDGALAAHFDGRRRGTEGKSAAVFLAQFHTIGALQVFGEPQLAFPVDFLPGIKPDNRPFRLDVDAGAIERNQAPHVGSVFDGAGKTQFDHLVFLPRDFGREEIETFTAGHGDLIGRLARRTDLFAVKRNLHDRGGGSGLNVVDGEQVLKTRSRVLPLDLERFPFAFGGQHRFNFPGLYQVGSLDAPRNAVFARCDSFQYGFLQPQGLFVGDERKVQFGQRGGHLLPLRQPERGLVAGVPVERLPGGENQGAAIGPKSFAGNGRLEPQPGRLGVQALVHLVGRDHVPRKLDDDGVGTMDQAGSVARNIFLENGGVLHRSRLVGFLALATPGQEAG